MNILLVTMEMNIGGAETHVLELARELKKQNNDVAVISAGGNFVPKLLESGITHIYAPLKDKKPRHVISSAKIIKKAIIERKIDIVHAHARIPGVICGYVCKKLKVHFVTTIHGIYRVNFLLKKLTNWGEKTLAVSEDICNHAIKEYNLDPKNVKVTVNGINLEIFRKQEITEDLGINLDKNRKKVIHISRLDKEASKVAETLIDISSELENNVKEGIDIIIVGSGNYIEELKQKAQCCKNVIFTGARTDVEKLLNVADVFVGVSRAALEAMATELPVILAGNPEYGQGYQGIFRKEDTELAKSTNFTCRGLEKISSEVLKKDILQILGESSEEMGKYNRSVVKEGYSVEKMAEDAINLYEF